MGIETAILGSSLIGGVSSLLGNNAAANATKDAAKAQAATQAQNTANAQPYLDAGKNALGTYMDALGLNGSGAQGKYFSSTQNDPGYTRLLDSGNDAIMRRQASLGLSGPQANTLSAISDYSGNLRNQFDQQRLSQIGGLVDTGRTATQGLAYANNGTTQGQAGAILAGAGYTGGMYNGLGQAAVNGVQQYTNYNMYNAGRNGGNNLGAGGYNPIPTNPNVADFA